MRRSSAARERHQRIVEALLDLDLEPAVDAAVDELERGQVHDQQRCDHQRSRRSPRCARSGASRARARGSRAPAATACAPAAPLSAITPQTSSSRIHSCRRLELAPSSARSWRAAGMRRARSPPTARAWPTATQRSLRGGASLHTGSDHVYHSLTRAQSSVQNRIARSDAGRCPRRTPARTLMV